MLKKILSFLLFLIVSVCVCAQNQKVLNVANGKAAAESVSDFQRLNQDGEAMIRPTVASAFFDEHGMTFEISFLMEDASTFASRPGEMELFFKPANLQGKQEYYQFYGRLRRAARYPLQRKAELEKLGVPWCERKEILPYYYTETNEKFPYLRDYRVEISYLANSAVIRIFLPWSDLAAVMPFDDAGKGAAWQFNVIRSAAGEIFTWQGRHHQPETWGKLQFPDVTERDLKRFYRNAALKICESPWLEKWHFSAESYEAGKKKLAGELERKKGTLPADPDAWTVAQWRAETLKLRSFAAGRRTVTTLNGKAADWKIIPDKIAKTVEYQFDLPENLRNGWLCDLDAVRSGKRMAVNAGVGDRENIVKNLTQRIGPVYKGKGAIRVSVPAGTQIYGTVEEYGLELEPPQGVSHSAFRDAPEPLAPRQKNGGIYAPFRSTHLAQCVHMLGDAPAVVWYGGGMLNGLNFQDCFRKFAEVIPTVNCGTVDDGMTRRTLWRIRYGVLDTVKPSYVVLNFDTGARLPVIAEIIAEVRRKVPAAKLILIGANPGDRDNDQFTPDAPFAKFNAGLKSLAEKNNVRFLDLSSAFYTPEGKLKRELIRARSIYYGESIYALWCKSVEDLIVADIAK